MTTTDRLANAVHGKVSTYGTLGCRCAECREANRIKGAERRARYRANPRLADMAGHGKVGTYINHGCRCFFCRSAHALAQQRYRANRAKRRAAQ